MVRLLLKTLLLWLVASLMLTVGVLALFVWLNAPKVLWLVYTILVAGAGVFMVARAVRKA